MDSKDGYLETMSCSLSIRASPEISKTVRRDTNVAGIAINKHDIGSAVLYMAGLDLKVLHPRG